MKSSQHIDLEILAGWVEGTLDRKSSETVTRHLAQCGRCQAEADIARDHFAVQSGADLGARSERLQREFTRRLQTSNAPQRRPEASILGVQHTSREPAAATRLRIFKGRRAALLMAAAAVAFALIGVRQMMPASPTLPSPSGKLRAVDTTKAIELTVTPSPNGWMLNWNTRQNLQDLRLTVEDEDGKILLRHPFDATELAAQRARIPLASLHLARGQTMYFIHISGLDDDGRRVKSRMKLLE